MSCNILAERSLLLLSPWEQLQSIVTSMSVCVVYLFVREDISGITHAIFTKFFAHVAYVCGLVLLRHIDDWLHCRLAGREGVMGVHSVCEV